MSSRALPVSYPTPREKFDKYGRPIGPTKAEKDAELDELYEQMQKRGMVVSKSTQKRVKVQAK
jgi:hypothetical protein